MCCQYKTLVPISVFLGGSNYEEHNLRDQRVWRRITSSAHSDCCGEWLGHKDCQWTLENQYSINSSFLFSRTIQIPDHNLRVWMNREINCDAPPMSISGYTIARTISCTYILEVLDCSVVDTPQFCDFSLLEPQVTVRNMSWRYISVPICIRYEIGFVDDVAET